MKLPLLVPLVVPGILASPFPIAESSATSSQTLTTTTTETTTTTAETTTTTAEATTTTTDAFFTSKHWTATANLAAATRIINRPKYHENAIGVHNPPFGLTPLQWLQDKPRCMSHYNQVWSECPIPCPATCDEPAPKSCRKKCKPGCTCKPGYKLNRIGYCVSDYHCWMNGFWKTWPGWWYSEDEKEGRAGPNEGAPFIDQSEPPQQTEADEEVEEDNMADEDEEANKDEEASKDDEGNED